MYAGVGRLYPGYIAACLLWPALSAARCPGSRPVYRIACSLLAAGFALVVSFTVLRLFDGIELGIFEILMPFAAILLGVLGLTLIRFSRRRGEPRATNRLM